MKIINCKKAKEKYFIKVLNQKPNRRNQTLLLKQLSLYEILYEIPMFEKLKSATSPYAKRQFPYIRFMSIYFKRAFFCFNIFYFKSYLRTYAHAHVHTQIHTNSRTYVSIIRLGIARLMT